MQNPRLPLGEDLVAGHVHAWVPADTAGSSHSPRVKRRIRAKTSLAELERRERGRSRIPEIPRLRTLVRDPADVPISEGHLPQQTLPQAAFIEHIRIHQSVQQLEVHHLNYFHLQETELPAIGAWMRAWKPSPYYDQIHHHLLSKILHRL